MEELNFNCFNTFILTGFLLVFIYSIRLLVKNYSKLSNIIAIIFLVACIGPFQLIYVDIGFQYHLFPLPRIQADIITIPLFYIFLKLYLEKIYCKHLLVLSIALVCVLILYSACFEYKFLNIPEVSYIKIANFTDRLAPLINLIFLFLCGRIVYKASFIKTAWMTHRIEQLKIVLYVISVLIFTWIIITLGVLFNYFEDGFSSYYLIYIEIIGCIYWMMYQGLPIDLVEDVS